MVHTSTFKKVGKSKKQMYGPRKILICGYPPPEHSSIVSIINAHEFDNLPVIFITDDDLEVTLKDLLTLQDRHGMGELSKMERAIIMSGLTHKELQKLMTSYRNAGLPRQLWASLTPTSENWTIKGLLNELASEAEAFNKRKS